MDSGAPLGLALKDGVGPAFELLPVAVAVLAQRAGVEVVAGREALYAAGLVEPGEGKTAADAAVFALDAEAFFEIAGDGDGQLQVSQAAVGEGQVHKPAVAAETVQVTRAKLHDVALGRGNRWYR